MYQLTENQLEIITHDVENQGINFSHLNTDLIDHVCCDIEARMNQGISFSQAYEQVKNDIGIKGLRQIQKDTLMLIDKKYRIMKKSMKLIGLFAMALMAFGVMFKIEHWPGASIMLLVSFLFTTMVFFPTFLYVVYRELNRKKLLPVFGLSFVSGALFMVGVLFKILHFPGAAMLIFLGLGALVVLVLPLIILLHEKTPKIHKTILVFGIVSLMLFLSGLIFKIQHWPGASIMLSAGSIALALLFIPLFYIREVSKATKPRIDFIFGIIALTYFIVFGFLLSMNWEKTALIDLHQQDKSFRQTSAYFTHQNQLLMKRSESEKVLQLSNQADILCDYIEAIKVMIVQQSENLSLMDAEKLNRLNPLLKSGTTAYLLPENNAQSPLPKLKSAFDSFQQLYANCISDSTNENTTLLFITNLDNNAVDSHSSVVAWDAYYFKNSTPAAALNTLSLWQYNVRLAQNQLLSLLLTNSK